MVKSHGRERGRKRPGITGSGDRQEEDRKETTDEVSKRNLRRCPKPRLVTTAGQTPTIPAYGRSGIRHERWPELAMRQLNGTWEPEIPMPTEKPQVEEPRGRKYECGFSGADCPVVVTKRGNARGAKGTGHSRHDRCGQLATGGTARLLRRERQLSLNGKSRVSREAQARICERLGVRLPGATRPSK